MKNVKELRSLVSLTNQDWLNKASFWVEDDYKKGFKECNFLPAQDMPLDKIDWLTSELVALGYSVDQDDDKYIIKW